MNASIAKARLADARGRLMTEVGRHNKTHDILGAIAINSTLEIAALLIEVLEIVEAHEKIVEGLRVKLEGISNPQLTPLLVRRGVLERQGPTLVTMTGKPNNDRPWTAAVEVKEGEE